jgi:hypothetical protein
MNAENFSHDINVFLAEEATRRRSSANQASATPLIEWESWRCLDAIGVPQPVLTGAFSLPLAADSLVDRSAPTTNATSVPLRHGNGEAEEDSDDEVDPNAAPLPAEEANGSVSRLNIRLHFTLSPYYRLPTVCFEAAKVTAATGTRENIFDVETLFRALPLLQDAYNFSDTDASNIPPFMRASDVADASRSGVGGAGAASGIFASLYPHVSTSHDETLDRFVFAVHGCDVAGIVARTGGIAQQAQSAIGRILWFYAPFLGLVPPAC